MFSLELKIMVFLTSSERSSIVSVMGSNTFSVRYEIFVFLLYPVLINRSIGSVMKLIRFFSKTPLLLLTYNF